MDNYERPIAELIDVCPTEALMLSPGSEWLGEDDEWED